MTAERTHLVQARRVIRITMNLPPKIATGPFSLRLGLISRQNHAFENELQPSKAKDSMLASMTGPERNHCVGWRVLRQLTAPFADRLSWDLFELYLGYIWTVNHHNAHFIKLTSLVVGCTMKERDAMNNCKREFFLICFDN